MEKAPQTLAEYLGTDLPPASHEPRLEDITDAKEFAQAVVASYEFRRFIVGGLTLGNLAPAIVTRLMDYAWGAPPKRLEVTGRDGKPIEQITEVRRVVVHVNEQKQPEEAAEKPVSVH